MTVRILPLRASADTAANWASVDPVPKLGEACLITDTNFFKWGDGASSFSALPFAKGAVAWGEITGTLSAQTDLQAALDAKQNTITPAALTRTNDTNVTLTLGGSPSSALLASMSLTLGWNGQLPVSRGGTGVSTSTGSGSVVLNTNPTFSGGASHCILSMSSGTGAHTGMVQTDSSGNLRLRTSETAGQAFIDTFGSQFAIRAYPSLSFILRVLSNELRPGSNNTHNLGSASFRWKEVFAGNATINTSDERLKQWLGGLTPQMVRAGLRIADEIGLFRWMDGSRVHVGVRAQQVARILIEEGVEASQPMEFAADVFIPEGERPSFRMAFLTFDTWEAEREPVMREKCVKRATATEPAVRDAVQRVATRSYRLKAGEVVDAAGLVWRERPAGNLFGVRTAELVLFLQACEAAERRRLAAALEALCAA